MEDQKQSICGFACQLNCTRKQSLVEWNCASCENYISVAATVIKYMVVLNNCKCIYMWIAGKPLNHPFLFHLYLFLVVGNFFGMTFGSERILISCQKNCAIVVLL